MISGMGAALALALAMSVASADSVLQTVPFHLQDNLVRLSATVNGVAVSAVLDSGTGAVIVDEAVAKRLGASPTSPVGSGLGGGTGAQKLFPLNVERLSIGGFHTEKISGVSMDLGALSMSAGFPVEALIGEPVFAHQIVRVDYPASRVSLRSPEESTACEEPLPITISNGVPVVEVDIQTTTAAAPTKLHLIVDLGTRHFAAMIGGRYLDSAEGRQLLQRATPGQVGVGTGGAVAGSVVRLFTLSVGRRRQANVPVALTRQVKAFEAGGIDGTLGVPFWSDGTITFDYPHSQLCLEP